MGCEWSIDLRPVELIVLVAQAVRGDGGLLGFGFGVGVGVGVGVGESNIYVCFLVSVEGRFCRGSQSESSDQV